MTKNEIINEVNSLLLEHFELDLKQIQPQTEIRRVINLDSMQALELVSIARKRFKIDMQPRHISSIITFEELYEYIFRNQKDE